MGDVAIQTKALCCTECSGVNTEATWIESLNTYPGRSVSDSSLRAEVSRCHSNPATSCPHKSKRQRSHKRTKDGMLEWQSNQEVYGKATTTETHQSTTCVRISRKLKVKHRRS